MEKTYVDFSSKITILSFVLSIGIVYQHTAWNYDANSIVSIVQQCFFFILESFVPLFFMISGYLFFRTYTPDKAKKKLLSRCKSLLIPYVIWNVIYVAFFLTLFKLGFVTNLDVPKGIGDLLLYIFDSRFSPLWFVKYLMVFVLLSPPILYYILKNKYLGIVVVAMSLGLNCFFYITGMMEVPINVNANNIIMLNYQIVYYLVGSYAAIHCKTVVEDNTKKKRVTATVLGIVLLVLIETLILCSLVSPAINHFIRLLLAIDIWFLFSWLPKINAKKWMKNSFFIYCSHLLILQPVQRVLDVFISRVSIPILYIFEYVVLPILIVVLIIIVAELLKKYVPMIASLLMGNRG